MSRRSEWQRPTTPGGLRGDPSERQKKKKKTMNVQSNFNGWHYGNMPIQIYWKLDCGYLLEPPRSYCKVLSLSSLCTHLILSYWISDRDDFNYFWSTSRPILPITFRFRRKEIEIDFQDGSRGGHLRVPIGKVLAIFDLQVTSILPIKFQVTGLSSMRKRSK